MLLPVIYVLNTLPFPVIYIVYSLSLAVVAQAKSTCISKFFFFGCCCAGNFFFSLAVVAQAKSTCISKFSSASYIFCGWLLSISYTLCLMFTSDIYCLGLVPYISLDIPWCWGAAIRLRFQKWGFGIAERLKNWQLSSSDSGFQVTKLNYST